MFDATDRAGYRRPLPHCQSIASRDYVKSYEGGMWGGCHRLWQRRLCLKNIRKASLGSCVYMSSIAWGVGAVGHRGELDTEFQKGWVVHAVTGRTHGCVTELVCTAKNKGSLFGESWEIWGAPLQSIRAPKREKPFPSAPADHCPQSVPSGLTRWPLQVGDRPRWERYGSSIWLSKLDKRT